MEAKLIKTVDGYELFTQGFLKGSTNHGLIDSLNIEEGSIRYKLSLKNCQVIENGYDLDELAKSVPHTCRNDEDWYKCRAGFIVGFQTAMEILGDKKFSKENMLKAFITGVFTEETSNHDFEFTELMKDLQQTEWDVTFNPEEKGSDGCLILKRL